MSASADRVAAHEAGHAIVSCAERTRWRGGVTIVPGTLASGEEYLGLCYLDGGSTCAVDVAGVIGERITMGVWPSTWDGARADLACAAECTPDEIERAILTAGEVLIRNRLAFDHVRRMLVQRGTIDAGNVRRAIAIWRDEQQPIAVWPRDAWQPLFEHVLALRAARAAA